MSRSVNQHIESYNNALDAFDGEAMEMFSEYHPAWDQILQGGIKETALRSNKIRYVRYTNGPGVARQYQRGGTLPGGRRDISVVGYHNAPVIIDYGWHLDGAEIQFDTDTAAVKTLLTGSEVTALADVYGMLVEQFLMGGVSGFANIMHLNGDETYNPGDGDVPNGMFHFAAPSAQTGTFAGLLRSGAVGGVPNHHNVYRQVTNMSQDGALKALEAYMECVQWGWQEKAAPTLAIADGTSWINMWRNYYERFVPTKMETDGGLPKYGRLAIALPGVGIPCYYEPAIDIAAYDGGSGRNGVVMAINPKSFVHIALPGKTYTTPKGQTKHKFFEHSPLEKIADGGRTYQGLLTWQGQFSALDLRTNFCLEGTATY